MIEETIVKKIERPTIKNLLTPDLHKLCVTSMYVYIYIYKQKVPKQPC